jgi:hypothetical protein
MLAPAFFGRLPIPTSRLDRFIPSVCVSIPQSLRSCRFQTSGVVAVRKALSGPGVQQQESPARPGGDAHEPGPSSGPDGDSQHQVSKWLLSCFVLPSYVASLADEGLTCQLQSLVRCSRTTVSRCFVHRCVPFCGTVLHCVLEPRVHVPKHCACGLVGQGMSVWACRERGGGDFATLSCFARVCVSWSLGCGACGACCWAA